MSELSPKTTTIHARRAVLQTTAEGLDQGSGVERWAFRPMCARRSSPEGVTVSRTAACSTVPWTPTLFTGRLRGRRVGRSLRSFSIIPTMTHYQPEHDDSLLLFGATNFRQQIRPFGIRDADRLHHAYVLGKTGTGKSTLLETFLRSDIRRGNGCALIDPHGDLADRVLDLIPRERIDDVIYFNPADLGFPVAFNVLESVPREQRSLVASGLVSIFRRLWAEFWGPRLEYTLRNGVLALLESPHTTLLDLSRLLVDDPFRADVLRHVEDPGVRHFWLREYANYKPDFRQQVIAPVQNKVGEFLVTPLVRNIVGQRRNLFQLRRVMDDGKILIVNLAKGLLGEDVSSLLGSMMLTRLMLAAFSRGDMPERERRPFFLFVDEFASFGATSTLTNLLSESRKYKLSVTLVGQYLEQMPHELRSAVFGNVGTIVSFRASAEDAGYLAREFTPAFREEDFVNLPNHHIYVRLCFQGVAVAPFSGTTLPPQPTAGSHREAVIEHSRRRYARPRHVVERGAVPHYLASRGIPTVGLPMRQRSGPDERERSPGGRPAGSVPPEKARANARRGTI